MSAETSSEKFPGEYFRGGLLQQDLHRFTEDLREKLEEQEDGPGFVQQRLHTHPNATISLIHFDQGGHLTDQTIEDATVTVQVLEGRICLQAGEAHRHPDEGDHLVIEPGATHAIQGQTESTVLLTIMRDQET
jgi:quercetin dioxygenase-like cupin family protein